MHVEAKRKHSEVGSDENTSEESEEETIGAKVDRLAALDDSLDEDFNPDGLSSSEADSSSVSDDSSVSATEIQILQDEANLILHRAFAGVAEVIAEEPEPIKGAVVEQKTVVNDKYEYSSTGYAPENSEERQEHHPPCKLGDVGDTAFYSPISSNSSSPDRTIPVVEHSQQHRSGGNGIDAKDTCRNGEVNDDPKERITGSSTDKRSNGHAKEKGGVATNVSAKVNKPQHRGRRAGHASRKKK